MIEKRGRRFIFETKNQGQTPILNFCCFVVDHDDTIMHLSHGPMHTSTTKKTIKMLFVESY
jgi:hypothetical protein